LEARGGGGAAGSIALRPSQLSRDTRDATDDPLRVLVMDADSPIVGYDNFEAIVEVPGLAALARIDFGSLVPLEILAVAGGGAVTLAACRVEASYRLVDGEMELCPGSQSHRPELTEILQRSGWNGSIELPQGDWVWAFPLCHRNAAQGCLVLSASAEPASDEFLLLELLAQQTGAALASAELHERDVRRTRQLEESNEDLAYAVQRLQARTHAHELLGAASAAGAGQQGIVDALHTLTGRSVCVEDRFGNLRAWGGPQQPFPHPKPKPDQRDRFLRLLSTKAGPVRSGDRVSVLIQPHAEILGVLALIDPGEEVDDDQLFALRYGSNVLGLEFSHQRNLAELQLNLCRELVDDLLAGTDDEGAYARAEALGHDLRRPHHVVAVHTGRGADNAGLAAARRAAANLRLNHLLGRQGSLLVLLADGQPDPVALHREFSRQLGHAHCAIGIGSRCDVPSDFPQSFLRARRALNIRLNSADPQGASAYDELGFYHLVDAAHTAGAADEYAHQWLGVLIDYDAAKNSDLVHTLSHYLECGGNYDESAAVLHVHRSTLRYRLGRIADLTGFDLRNIDTRFNLHAATRVWRFLTPE
jgi:PucR C-terminal helix-turn-helix domain/GGDEF-like domain